MRQGGQLCRKDDSRPPTTPAGGGCRGDSCGPRRRHDLGLRGHRLQRRLRRRQHHRLVQVRRHLDRRRLGRAQPVQRRQRATPAQFAGYHQLDRLHRHGPGQAAELRPSGAAASALLARSTGCHQVLPAGPARLGNRCQLQAVNGSSVTVLGSAPRTVGHRHLVHPAASRPTAAPSAASSTAPRSRPAATASIAAGRIGLVRPSYASGDFDDVVVDPPAAAPRRTPPTDDHPRRRPPRPPTTAPRRPPALRRLAGRRRPAARRSATARSRSPARSTAA